MPLQTNNEDFIQLLKGFSFNKNGDYYEKQHFVSVLDHFPRIENMWQYLIVPLTNRVDPGVVLRTFKDDFRPTTSKSMQDMASMHYSCYLNLCYAYECLLNKHTSYFENFYTHLGSACDLAEEFLTQLYFFIIESTEAKTEILQQLSKTKFLDIAKEWYDKYYQSAYTFYLSKGKVPPIKLISRSNILNEYFSQRPEWKKYVAFSLQIRTYRNVIVHNTQLASAIINGTKYVPKKEKVGKYKKWHDVFSAKQGDIDRDFISRDEQMLNDFIQLKSLFNEIWEKPIQDVVKLLYDDKNIKALEKLDIQFI